MGSKICMRENCAATTSSPEWKEGWSLKSGGLATLCYQCGSAYANFFFCETFHQEESGWRECKICGKQIHCGCIASKYMHDFLDSGGVGCIGCIRDLETRLVRPVQISSNDIPNGHGTSMVIGDENRVDGDNINKAKLMQLSKSAEENQPNYLPQPQNGDLDSSNGQIKQEENMLPSGEDGTGLLHLSQQCGRSSMSSKPDRGRPSSGIREMYESLAQPSSVFSYNSPLGMTNSVLHFPGGVVEGREKSKVPPMQQGQRARHILPKPPKSGTSTGSQANKGTVSHSQTRVARPPAEGRGRNQLLPRYWPRITDQELQQLSGDLNSTIVPLFEKVLSASDAGRIGRLVLPKACAEVSSYILFLSLLTSLALSPCGSETVQAYFPPISQSEGIPIRVQDIKGKEWTFQFRFWPNNNSRMYVLEGVTPCIQNMQLQAGDTVTFSRIDPGGKLVMGFRRATNSVDMQESQTCPLSNGGLSGETSFSGVSESLLTETFGWRKNETRGGMTNEDLLQRPMLISEKKKTRNIGSKSKRLLMHNEDAMELRITWEDAQELLCPPPSAKPTIVMVENYEFEEYDEPPVFGKRTIFTARASG
ncbi:hypothetical protein RJ640_025230 [Escallonia rubra]|uniref:TF-B3 domain-containing protein n=1 Tax=Escallonia rubra TaxID=112253 RepID=A0AA88RWH1_9ASTE|nr:hypothetical protein RJ640_025230 [Escallonia rubra]